MKRLLITLLSLLLIIFIILALCIPVTAKISVPPSGSNGIKNAPKFQISKSIDENKKNSSKSDGSTTEFDFEFDSVTGTITAYIGTNTTINIPSHINETAVKHIGEQAFAALDITSVTIPDGVLTIGLGAFAYCYKLHEIFLPNSVKNLDKYAFYGCSSLEKITLPNQLECIGDACFRECVSLKRILIPNSVTKLGTGAFYWCFALESAVISNQLTRIEDFTFELCEAMKSIAIPNSVTFVGYHAFWACAAAESLTLSKNLTAIEEEAFYYLPLITSIEIPDSVTYIGNGAFKYSEKITSLILSDQLTYIGSSAFSQCLSLTRVSIPATVTSIGTNAFAYDDALEEAAFNGSAPISWGTDVFLNTAANFTIYYLSENTRFSTPMYQGYPSTCLFHIDVKKINGERITVSNSSAAAGTAVMLTVTPELGKSVLSIYYRDADGKHVINGSQFIMPASDVTISASFDWNGVYIAFILLMLLIILGFSILFLARRKT